MNKIKSAKLKVDLFGRKKGQKLMLYNGWWGMLEGGRYIFNDSDLLTLADHGIVEIEYEKELTETKVGEWQEKEQEEDAGKCQTCLYWMWDCNNIDGDCIHPSKELRCVKGNRQGWTPRKPESEKHTIREWTKEEISEGFERTLDIGQKLFTAIESLERRLDAIEKTARTNPYHPFDIVGAVKELQEKVGMQACKNLGIKEEV